MERARKEGVTACASEMSAAEVAALREFLESKVLEYETRDFIEADPVSVPHMFSSRGDIEVAGLLSALIAWGNRVAIVSSARRMVELMGCSPYDFVMSASEGEVSALGSFTYRTFQQDDLPGVVRGLRSVYASGPDALERLFVPGEGETVREGISRFRAAMLPHLSPRTHKHLADTARGAAGKRMNMFLRWMVRPSVRGVDFGLWKSLRPSDLRLPLDVHTGRTARGLGLLRRAQNDWKAVEEVTASLRMLDSADPVRYDFALFSLGIVEGFMRKSGEGLQRVL